MRTIQLDLLFTILAALVVLFTGRALIARSAFLKRFSIPPPVVGGVLVAILLALADVARAACAMSFDMSLRDNLLLMFFTTVGLSADARMLLQRRAPKLLHLPRSQHRVHRDPERSWASPPRSPWTSIRWSACSAAR